MKSQIITIGLATIAAALIGGYFCWVSIALDGGKTLTDKLTQVKEACSDRRWSEARTNFLELEQMWERSHYILSLNVSEDEIKEFQVMLTELEGAIEAQDEQNAVTVVTVARHYWMGMIKMIPGP